MERQATYMNQKTKTANMSILFKLTYGIHVISIKIQKASFYRNYQADSKIYTICNGPRIAKTMLKRIKGTCLTRF